MSSFRIYKNASYDTLTSSKIDASEVSADSFNSSSIQVFNLTFTGPYTITIECTFTRMGNIGLLSIPVFANTVSASTDLFLGTLPGYFNGCVGMVSAPARSNSLVVAGTLAVADTFITLKNEEGNYVGSSGLGGAGWLSVPVIFR